MSEVRCRVYTGEQLKIHQLKTEKLNTYTIWTEAMQCSSQCHTKHQEIFDTHKATQPALSVSYKTGEKCFQHIHIPYASPYFDLPSTM